MLSNFAEPLIALSNAWAIMANAFFLLGFSSGIHRLLAYCWESMALIQISHRMPGHRRMRFSGLQSLRHLEL